MQRIFRLPIFRTTTVVLLALLGLAGCQANMTSLKSMAGLGPEDGVAVAQTGPMSGIGGAIPVSSAGEGFKASTDSSKLIFVVPVEGAGGPAPLVLADAVAASLRDAGQPAVLSEKANERGPTIVGRITEAKQSRSIVWVTVVWELRAPHGTAVAEYRQQIIVDAGLWKTGSAEAINLLVYDAGPRVSAMVKKFISPMAMPAKMGEVETGRAAKKQAALETIVKEAAIRDRAVPGARREPVSRPKVVPQPAPRPVISKRKAAPATKIKQLPQIKSRFKGPVDKQAVAALMDKISKEPKQEPEPKNETPKKSERKIGKPRALIKLPEKAKPKVKFKKKPILMPVPEEGPSRLVAKSPAVGWKRPAFLIKQVQGAPGDGNKALMRSMKVAMRKNELTVTEDSRQAGFVIAGRVELSAAINGRQQARIVWAVNTVDGDEVGKAVQENAIKAGSLDGSWGRVSDIVSIAAIVGIQELFGIQGKQSSRGSREIKFSRRADVPRVPGRALPPP